MDCREDIRENEEGGRETEEEREEDDERQGRGREARAGWKESQGRLFVERKGGRRRAAGTRRTMEGKVEAGRHGREGWSR